MQIFCTEAPVTKSSYRGGLGIQNDSLLDTLFISW